jgi:hypothetical protein
MALTRPRASNFVDSDYKQSCRTVTTTNITLSSGAPSIYDGLTLALSDRILVAAQNNPAQNGIYTVQVVGTGSDGTWVRSPDASDSTRITGGMQVSISEGSKGGSAYKLITPDPITLGVTNLTFISAAAVAAGDNSQIQYNNTNSIAGAANFTYNFTTGNVVVGSTTNSLSPDTGALVVKGGLGINSNLTVGGDMLVYGNITSRGNVYLSETTDLVVADSIIQLHTFANLDPLLSNDGRDIGFAFHYYDTQDRVAFLGRSNDTGYLEWYGRGIENAGNVFTGTYGTFQSGNLILSGNIYRGTNMDTEIHAIAYTKSTTPPVGPKVGDQWYDTSTDTIYEWIEDGTSAFWVDKLGTATTVTYTTGSTQPTSPKSGDYWYDTSTDTLYTRVYDGTTSYWVDFSTQPATVGTSYLQTGYLVANNINTTGNVVIQGTLSAASITFNSLSIPGTVSAQNYTFANGVSLISSIPGIYGNSNVSSYLSSGTLNATDTTSTSTGSIVTPGGIAATGNVYVGKNLYIGSTAFSQTFANPTIVAVDSGSNYAQMAMKNTTNTGSADYAAYADNGSDAGGWIDMGIAGSAYSDGNYTITKPQDGSLIVRPTSNSYGGNLIIGTSEAGSYNDIVFGVGSFHANAEVARFHGNTSTGGNVIFGTNLTVSQSALFRGPYDEYSLLSGVFVGNTGAGTPSPRIGFYTGDTAKNWQIDNFDGVFRWFVPGTTKMSLYSTGNLNVTGGYTVGGKKAVNGPAFRAYVSVGQTISSVGSQIKVTFGGETFDTDGCFASSTFTPTVEGYYQLNATVRLSGPAGTGENMLILYRNGTEYARGTNGSGTEIGANFYSMQVSDIAYANGTTDTFEVYIQQGSGTNKDTTAGQNISYFSGVMVRGA